ncbi:Fic family protein [Candidatus Saganbacteria bacterium]|nr:Fic family protein [Candidatus Saganbacteria bacterium]
MFKPNYQLTNLMTNCLTAIAEAREAILLSPILPKVEPKLLRDAMISRSHHSTSIEGNPLNLEQVKIIADGGKLVAREKDKQEVINYLAALKSLEKTAKDKVFSEKAILGIQKIITRNILSDKDCGKYRQQMVYVINSFGQTVFTPPPVTAVPKLAADLIKWLNSPAAQEINPVLAAGIVHYELVRIHPFVDGNGRTARALATLILYQRNFDIKHFFALDDYYNENRQAYYDALQYIDPQTRDLTQWLEYFTEGVMVQMNKLRAKIDRLAREPIFGQLKGRVILKERQWKALEQLQETKEITNLEYQKVSGITRETAKRDLAFLVKQNILEKLGRGKATYYKMAARK